MRAADLSRAPSHARTRTCTHTHARTHTLTQTQTARQVGNKHVLEEISKVSSPLNSIHKITMKLTFGNFSVGNANILSTEQALENFSKSQLDTRRLLRI